MVFKMVFEMSDDEAVILYFLLVVIGSAIGVIIGEAFLVVLRGVIRFALKCVTHRFYYRYFIRVFKICLLSVALWVCICLTQVVHFLFLPTRQLLIAGVTPNFNADHCKICDEHNRYNTVFGHICCAVEVGLIQMNRKCHDLKACHTLDHLKELWDFYDCLSDHVEEWILPALEQKYYALNPRNDAMIHYFFLDDLNELVRWLVWRVQSSCCNIETPGFSVSVCMDEFRPWILSELNYWLYKMVPGSGRTSVMA